jgi:hypothetical protein
VPAVLSVLSPGHLSLIRGHANDVACECFAPNITDAALIRAKGAAAANVMADPEVIHHWRRLDDRITTSGQPTEDGGDAAS